MDFDRLASRDVSHFAPAPADGNDDVVWRDDECAMDRTTSYRKEAACWSLTLLDEVRTEEPPVTAAVQSAAADVGGSCRGLAFRMKSPDSLARKLDNEMAKASRQQSGHALDVEAIARGESDDALRYTIALERHGGLPTGLERTIESLRAQGWEPIEVKDSYLSGNSYKGLHLIARTPEHRVVEVQLHSEESAQVKESIHEDYEIARDRSRSRADTREAARRCIEASRQVPSPSGLAGYYPAGRSDDGEATGLVGDVPIRKKAYTRSEGGAR